MFLPSVQRICNSRIIEPIGVSPAALLFGQCVDLSRGFYKPFHPSDATDTNMVEWNQQMLVNQLIFIAAAQERQNRTNEMNKNLRDVGESKYTNFEVDDFELVQNKGNSMGRTSKLNTFWKGPMQIREKKGNEFIVRE